MADYNKPLPQATPQTQEFWDGLKRGELRIQQCQDCNEHYFYPRSFCPHCHSRNVEWTTASGKGTVETFVINHQAFVAFAESTPYVIAVISLEEGPRMMTNLVNVEVDPEHISVDMPVEIVYDAVTDEVTLPKFQPAS
ncbi:MAG TPA: Zn-ribbon domain-containing OB-fold protein [Dehalococcoidia bacterium]|nr:Zn-ribbon domain-containing OB-fold protein [Dehalococcoidia bacterium]